MVQGSNRARQNEKKKKKNKKQKKRYVIKFLELDLNCSFKLIVLIFICQNFHSIMEEISFNPFKRM
jgi:hypothetical protein